MRNTFNIAMSPASSGTLEIERYIGACLISQNHHNNKLNGNGHRGGGQNTNGPKNRYLTSSDVYTNNYLNLDNRFQRLQRCNSSGVVLDGWMAGGMPLISYNPTTNYNTQRRNEQFDNSVSSTRRPNDRQTPLARLAVHTQGAPLILTKNFNYHRNKKVQTNKTTKPIENTTKQLKNPTNCQKNCNGVDTISVTSDESSANSENSLPRIIKPRKRRKKDRAKPSLVSLGRPLSQDGFSTDSTSSPDIDLSTITTDKTVILRPFNFDSGGNPSTPLSSTSHINDLSETPKLHHCFEDVEELQKDMNGNESMCQCRYCDPSGQIWDIDRSCYSPFLTSPLQTFQYPLPNVKIDDLLGKNCDTTRENYCLIHSMSSISLDDDIVANNKFNSFGSSSRDLEVSTEIVTSLHGHRDLEIKFFSTTPPVDTVETITNENISDKQFNNNNKCNLINECKILVEE